MIVGRRSDRLRLLERALDATQNGVMITDATEPDDPIVYVNRAFEEITGYASEEVLGRNPRLLQAGEDQPALEGLREARRAHNDEIEWTGTLRNYRKDGTLFYNELSAAAVCDEEGRTTHHIGVINDVTERERVEEEVRFRARLIDAVGQAVVAVDLSGRIVYWNRAAEQLYGWSARETVGRPVEEVMVSEDQAEGARGIWAGLVAGRSWSGEFVVTRRDGTKFPALVTDTPVLDEQGVLVGVIGVSTDVSGRKEAEKKLREADERYRTLIEQMPAVTYIEEIEHDNTPVFVSPQVEEVSGYGPEDFYADPKLWYDVVHPEDRARVMAEDRRTDEPYSTEYRLVHREGRVVWVRDAAVLIEDEGGRPRYWHGVMLDVTDRKEAEEKLKESEQRFRALTEAALEGILITEGGRILEANQAYADIFGYDLSEMVGRPVLEFAAPESVELVREKISKGAQERYEAVAYKKDGARIHVEICGRPSTYRGRAVRVTAVRDVTERRRAEESLREANRRLEELAVLRADFGAMVAHELGSPLAAVRAHAEVMATGELGPEERDRSLDRIATEIDILMALVADVRFAASVEREDFSLRIRAVPVGQLLDDAAAFAQTLPGDHPLAVEAGAPDEMVVADPYRIGQVLRNLLANAAKYTPDGTPVTLRTLPAGPVADAQSPGIKPPGRALRLEVADDGPGIHPDDAPRIFEKFGRGRDRQVPGAGLGLYLSRRIIRAHGSDLAMRSEPGEGSVFSFELNVAPGDAPEQ